MAPLNIPFYLLGTPTPGRYPGDGTLRALHDRELCINTKDQILFYTNSAGTLVSMPINPTLFAMLGGAAFTASPTAPTPAAGDNTTKLSTTAFVAAAIASLAPLASPALTGTPTAPTAAALTNSTQLATTAYADKAVAAATARTPVSTGNYPALVTDRLIAYTALAAASTVTLPNPANFPKGASIILVDEAGTATGSITLTLAPNGTEKINGASSYVIAAAYGYVQVETNGTNWTIIDSNAFSSSALGSSAPAMDGTAAAGSASTAARSDHVHPSDASRAPLYAVGGWISGLKLSNDTTTPATVLDIAAGVATSDDGSASIRLATAFTKTTGAWAAGTTKGGLDTGSIAASTWYHVFVISGTGGTDVLISASPTAPTMPTGFTVKRRVGSIRTNSSSQILAFSQTGDRFDWSAPFAELNGNFGQTTAVTQALLGVPTGVQVQAILCGDVWDNTTASPVLLISSLGQADNAPSGQNATAIPPSTASGTYSAYVTTVVTDTSGRARFRTSSTTMNLQCSTTGYIDARGK